MKIIIIATLTFIMGSALGYMVRDYAYWKELGQAELRHADIGPSDLGVND